MLYLPKSFSNILFISIDKLLPKCHFFSCRPRTFFKGPGFQNACENGKHLDNTTGKCEETFRFRKTDRRSIRGHRRTVLEFLRFRQQHGLH